MPMAIFGSFSTVQIQVATDARFTAAMVYAAEALKAGSPVAQRIAGIALGVTEKVGLSGGAFALEQVYLPRVRPDAFFESHRNYIDVQVLVEGEELMEVHELTRLTVSDPYNPERDLIKYADAADAAVLRVRAGDVAIFFPEDGHMPSLRWRGPGLARKTVVKVPVR